jgi:hypothetical protein
MRLTLNEYEIDLLRAALVIAANDWDRTSKDRGGCDIAGEVSRDCWSMIHKINEKKYGKNK